jgi:phospholipid/cholesterol/gamma-HCH transport system substrate-binding protein
MKNTLETRLGVFFALAIIAAAIVLEMTGVDFIKPHKDLNALFKNVQELKIGDPVKLAGVQVGRVGSMKIEKDKVRVLFKVDKGTIVKTDSKATIKFAGLMGQNYVSLDFGTADSPVAEPGSTLESTEQADISSLMAKLDNVASGIENVTKSFTGDKIDNLFGPITDFVKQNSGPLTATIGNMKIVSDRIAKGEGTVGRLINEDALYVSALNTVSNLQSTADDVKLMLEDARKVVNSAQITVDGINAGQGTLGKLAKDEKLYNETSEAMANLKEILQKINRGQGSVGKLVNDESLLKNIKLSLQKLDKATEGLEDTGPLSVMGTVVNSLF